jgi:oligopeptide transport system substrate-binding protein
MRSKWLVLVVVLVIASMVLGACKKAPEAPSQTLRVNLGTYPDILDPQKASFVNEIAHLQLMYEGLTKLNTNLETVPGAAEKWEYNADATEVTFTLRKNLKYSDGTLLNAKRFEYALLRNIDPATAGEYAAITDDIAGAAAWRGADLTAATPEQLAELKAAVAVHAYQADGTTPCTGYDDKNCTVLKVGTTNPAPYIHTVLSLWVTFPAKEEIIATDPDTWWTVAANHIGNGPFILTNLEANSVGNFVPNPNYWGGYAKVNIEYRYITDSAVAFEAYKNGEFDIVPLAAEDLATVQADETLSKEAMIYPGSCTYAYMFHQNKEPFTDQKVREAFSYALNREGWVTDVLKGLGSPTLTWIPKGFPGYDAEESRWGFDPEAAKQAIADSSYGSVENLPEITATFSDTPRNRTRNEWLAANYKDVLGVDIVLNPVEATTYTALTKDITTAPQMYILGWCADYPDPQNWLSVYWKTGGFGQRIGYSNPELDALLTEADKELDTTKRMQLYADAQKLLTDGAPVAFFWNNVNTYLVKPYVKGITTTPMDSGWAGIYAAIDITIQK